MSAETPQREAVEQLAEEFVARYRRGERPSLTEYVARCPEQEAEIRDLFPALVVMEQVAPADDDSLSPGRRRGGAAAHPDQLGDYRILREVGRGGMGVVYEAEQLSLGRHVALKVLANHALLDPRQRLRFHREARAAARLHHTNIVPVYGVGEDAGLHYYVMQYIPGLGLDQVLDELRRLHCRASPADGPASRAAVGFLSGTLSAPADPPAAPPADTVVLPGQSGGAARSHAGREYWLSVARLGAQVAAALQYAHQQGVVHRDIKPSNLLLDARGNVWVTDFGLAKAAEGGDDLTRTGDVVGTLRYMAPERFRGSADVRGDVYSLGLTLYELITLRPAFAAADRESLISQVMDGTPPPPPRRLAPHVPRDLETVVLKAIARDPDRRYATPGELADDLGRFIDDRPVRASRESSRQRLARWCRRNQGLAAALFGVALLLVALTCSAVAAALYFREQQRRMDAERGAAVTARALVEERDRVTRRRLYFSQMHQAHQAWFAHRGRLRMRELLTAWLPAPPADDQRGWEWYYLDGLQRHARRTLTDRPIDAAAWHPDGRLVATGGRDGRVQVWDAADGREVQALSTDEPVTAVAWRPDGRRLAAIGARGTGRVWDAATGEELARQAGVWWSAAWSPDGTRLATGGPGNEVVVRDAGLNPLRTLSGHGFHVHGVAWSPDGARLASGGGDDVRIWDAESGRLLQTLSGHGRLVAGLAWQPNGRLVAAASFDRVVRVWDADTGQKTATLTGHSHLVMSVSWSPAGDRLVSCGEDEVVRFWGPATGTPLGVIRDDATRAWWSPDGRSVLSAGEGGARLWDVGVEQEGRLPAGHQGGLASAALAWSPDGTRLASAAGSSGVQVYDVAAGREAARFEAHPLGVTALAWGPRGAPLASGGQGSYVRLWDSATGAERRLIKGHRGVVNTLAYRLDGAALASGSGDGTVRVWDPATGAEQRTVAALGSSVRGVAWRPDGKQLAATAEGGAVRVWDAATWQEVVRLPDGAGGLAVCWSPDGRRLAVSRPRAADGVAVYDARTGERLAVMSGHTDWVYSLAWSPDGTRLASGGIDSAVRLWDPDTGAEALTRPGLRGPVRAVAWDPAGRRLASAGEDNVVHLWDGRPPRGGR